MMQNKEANNRNNEENTCKEKNKRIIFTVIPLVLFLALAIFTVIKIQGYGDELISKKEIQYWTYDNVLKLYHIPVKDGEIVQKFKAAADDMTQFIVEFDDYSSEDTASLIVTLEDGLGNEYYRYECPTMAFGASEPFYLMATPEKKLKKNEIYEIHIKLDSPGSDITVRTIARKNTHRSAQDFLVNGSNEENYVLYFFQSYNAESSYAVFWTAFIALALLITIAILMIPSKLPGLIWNYGNSVFLCITGFYLIQLMDQGRLDTVYSKFIWVNIFLLLGIFLVLKGVFGRIGFYISGILVFLLGVTEYYVLQFKGEPFLLTDLSAFSTTMSVIGNYTFYISPVIMTGIVLILSLFIVQLASDLRWLETAAERKKDVGEEENIKQKNKRNRLIRILVERTAFILAGAIIVTSIYYKDTYKELSLFSLGKSISKMGYCYSNMCILRLAHIEKPSSYSSGEIERIVSEIEEPDKQNSAVKPKNLIVIMNESLSDLRIVGDMQTNEEFMPYLISLDKNTVKGQLYVNTFGGGTSVTEYEFLTGNTVKFFPVGSKPYSNACREIEEGMVRTLQAQGYYAVAMHPYGPKNWNRNVVYPELGFNEFLDESSYEGAELIRNYVSDKADYDFIIDYINQYDREEPLFIFNVTMQNHGGYDINNGVVEKTIEIQNMEETSLADNYLSLIKESDSAFEYLTSYFSTQEDPTMIVMFGDHQPQLSTEFYEELLELGNNTKTLEDSNNMYITPYIIWTNYDSDFEQMPVISANYLGSYVLQCAGLELTDYNKFLLQQQKTVPAIGMDGVRMADGTFVEYQNLDSNVLMDYRVLQYLRVQSRDEKFYSIFRLNK